MTPLAAVKKMAETPSTYETMMGDRACVYCFGDEKASVYRHEPDCPTLALPQIVAALEAAEKILSHQEPYWVQPRSLDATYSVCGGVEPPLAASHAPTCQWLAAQKALKG